MQQARILSAVDSLNRLQRRALGSHTLAAHRAVGVLSGMVERHLVETVRLAPGAEHVAQLAAHPPFLLRKISAMGSVSSRFEVQISSDVEGRLFSVAAPAWFLEPRHNNNVRLSAFYLRDPQLYSGTLFVHVRNLDPAEQTCSLAFVVAESMAAGIVPDSLQQVANRNAAAAPWPVDSGSAARSAVGRSGDWGSYVGVPRNLIRTPISIESLTLAVIASSDPGLQESSHTLLAAPESTAEIWALPLFLDGSYPIPVTVQLRAVGPGGARALTGRLFHLQPGRELPFGLASAPHFVLNPGERLDLVSFYPNGNVPPSWGGSMQHRLA